MTDTTQQSIDVKIRDTIREITGYDVGQAAARDIADELSRALAEDEHDPLCSIGTPAGDQTMPCDCAGPAIIRLPLWCPRCRAEHLDVGEWENRPHRTHLCLSCGLLFRVEIDGAPTCGIALASAETPREGRDAKFAEIVYDALRGYQDGAFVGRVMCVGQLPVDLSAVFDRIVSAHEAAPATPQTEPAREQMTTTNKIELNDHPLGLQLVDYVKRLADQKKEG